MSEIYVPWYSWGVCVHGDNEARIILHYVQRSLIPPAEDGKYDETNANDKFNSHGFLSIPFLNLSDFTKCQDDFPVKLADCAGLWFLLLEVLGDVGE